MISEQNVIRLCFKSKVKLKHGANIKYYCRVVKRIQSTHVEFNFGSHCVLTTTTVYGCTYNLGAACYNSFIPKHSASFHRIQPNFATSGPRRQKLLETI